MRVILHLLSRFLVQEEVVDDVHDQGILALQGHKTRCGKCHQGNCNYLDTSHTTTKALSQLTEVVQTSTVG